mmetsp:Transcript_12321/g.43565  ORF Transcript_12321/g.43565 Transcript_12321/m.43565 type:complete len:318 (-) Transcript_12321:360-1313(-)
MQTRHRAFAADVAELVVLHARCIAPITEPVLRERRRDGILVRMPLRKVPVLEVQRCLVFGPRSRVPRRDKVRNFHRRADASAGVYNRRPVVRKEPAHCFHVGRIIAAHELLGRAPVEAGAFDDHGLVPHHRVQDERVGARGPQRAAPRKNAKHDPVPAREVERRRPRARLGGEVRAELGVRLDGLCVHAGRVEEAARLEVRREDAAWHDCEGLLLRERGVDDGLGGAVCVHANEDAAGCDGVPQRSASLRLVVSQRRERRLEDGRQSLQAVGAAARGAEAVTPLVRQPRRHFFQQRLCQVHVVARLHERAPHGVAVR